MLRSIAPEMTFEQSFIFLTKSRKICLQIESKNNYFSRLKNCSLYHSEMHGISFYGNLKIEKIITKVVVKVL